MPLLFNCIYICTDEYIKTYVHCWQFHCYPISFHSTPSLRYATKARKKGHKQSVSRPSDKQKS